ncbi:MAG: SGNH/GDSL hydrolase family protein [Thermodesulfobacteriota bacterium]
MKLKKTLVLAASILISLIVLEIGLRVLSATLIYSPKSTQVYDDRLGRRIDPSLPDIDENGFRNPEVPADTGVVVLGDSHTYGVNVVSGESWPAQLARMSGLPVYNLGVGGYGTLQYYYLLDSAVKLRPERIIVGLYPANDLSDVCKLIDESSYWREWAHTRGYDVGICAGSTSLLGRLNRTLSGLHVYWMAASAIKRLNESTDFGDAISIEDQKNPTIMKYATIDSHKKKMDLSREKISLGLAVTEDALREMNEKARALGIEFSVVLIPSKEIVFYEYLRKNGYEPSDDYIQLVDNEKKLVAELSRYMDRQGIEFTDARPYVERELYGPGHVYSTTDDGHPLEEGYEAYARAAYEGILTDDPGEKERLGLVR